MECSLKDDICCMYKPIKFKIPQWHLSQIFENFNVYNINANITKFSLQKLRYYMGISTFRTKLTELRGNATFRRKLTKLI